MNPKEAAIELAVHSFWAGVAVVAITLVAVGLRWFAKLLILLTWIDSGSPHDWAITICEWILLGIDIAVVIAVVGKLSWKLVKSV